MNYLKLTSALFALIGTTLLANNTTLAASKNDLGRCLETGYIGSTSDSCGGNNLKSGVIQVTSSGKVSVTVKGALADPYSLYEVYWLPTGNTATTAQLIGNFVTDCHGDSIQNSGSAGTASLKTITNATEIKSSHYANIFSLVGNVRSGVFLVYDRGPYSYDTTATLCKPTSLTEYTTINSQKDTSVTKSTSAFANPPVVQDFRIQFMSGYHK